MTFRSLRVLAGLALMAAGAGAQAEMLPGTIFYSALLKFSEPANPSAIHQYVVSVPTLAQCQHDANEILAVRSASPYFYNLVSMSGCAFHISGFASAEAVHLDAELVTDFDNQYGVLRQRYRIDEFEAELSRLYKRLQPTR